MVDSTIGKKSTGLLPEADRSQTTSLAHCRHRQGWESTTGMHWRRIRRDHNIAGPTEPRFRRIHLVTPARDAVGSHLVRCVKARVGNQRHRIAYKVGNLWHALGMFVAVVRHRAWYQRWFHAITFFDPIFPGAQTRITL